MPFTWFVALRFLREGRTQTVLILSAVAVGVGVIVFLSALIDGLQRSLIDRTLASQAHVVVSAPEDAPRPVERHPADVAVASRVEKAPQRKSSIAAWPAVLEVVRRTPGVVAAAPRVEGSAFASRGATMSAISLRGVEPESYERVTPISPKLLAGRFDVTGSEAVIGKELAEDLGAGIGDKIRISTGADAAEVYAVEGIFDLGNEDANLRQVFVPLRSGQSVLGLSGEITAIDVRVEDLFSADRAASALRARTGLVADSWMERNRELMIGLRSQSSSRWLIELFVVIAVALGIASVLAVSVVQKSREIGILKAFGTTTGKVMRIFLLQGGVVGAAGSLAGCALGAALATFFARLARNPDGSALFPVLLRPSLFAGASLVALLTGLLAAWLPARRAAKLDPAKVIRYG